MKKLNLIMTLVIACSALTAFAAQADENADIAAIEATQAACLDKAMSNMEMKMCVGEAYQSADALLNKVYGDMVQSLKSQSDDSSKEILKRLVAAEKGWVAYKESECSYQGTSMLGGSGESLVISGCLVEKTEARIKELRATN